MKPQNSPLYVSHRSNLGLIVISTDAGNGKGEQTIMTLNPAEAKHLGTALVELGNQHGGNPS